MAVTDKIFKKVARTTLGAMTFALVFFGVSTADAQMMRLDSIPYSKIDRAEEPFGRAVNTAPAGPMWIKWRGVDDGFAKDHEAIEGCRAATDACSPAAARLIALIDEAKALTGRRKLATINRAINLSISYTSDDVQFGKSDEWSSAVATFASGRGDCEDYAIAKMFTLHAAGIALEDLRILVARERGGDLHALLAVRNEGHWLLLDNRTMMLVEDSHSRDLTPIYTFALDGMRSPAMQNVAAKSEPVEIKQVEIQPVAIVAQAFGVLDTPYWF